MEFLLFSSYSPELYSFAFWKESLWCLESISQVSIKDSYRRINVCFCYLVKLLKVKMDLICRRLDRDFPRGRPSSPFPKCKSISVSWSCFISEAWHPMVTNGSTINDPKVMSSIGQKIKWNIGNVSCSRRLKSQAHFSPGLTVCPA